MEEIYWQQADGTSILVDDMDVKHFRNFLKMILRNKQKTKLKARIVELEGDIAQMFNDEWYDENNIL